MDGSTRRAFLRGVGALPAAINAPREFRDFYFAGLLKNGIVGSTFLLLRDKKLSVNEVYGYSEVAKKTPIDWNTCYHWASITKTFTAIAVMQLRDRGRLQLTDPVSHYVPELHQIHNPYGPVESITIRHLLTHSAGFRNPTWPGRTATWQPFEPTKWSQIVAMLPYTSVDFRPGSRHSY